MIKNCQIYSPRNLGKGDIFMAGGQICAIGDLEPPRGMDVQVIDAMGMRAIPGLVDGHVHVTGGGGEGGPASRTGELQLGQLEQAGVTTVVGCLGFDGITRTVESVLMKIKALRAQGYSAWCYTGSYQVPPPTITGDIARDIALFEEIIGVGEVAIADARSSFPSIDALIRLARAGRTGGMIGGCQGLIHLHLGDEADPFEIIQEAVERGNLKYHHFYPTHCSRTHAVFEAALAYAKHGPVDLTASSHPYFPDHEPKPSQAVRRLLEHDVPLSHITLSSDACGSLPRFDSEGRLVGHDIGQPDCLLREVFDMVALENIPFEDALTTVTLNPATILGLPGKGRIEVGAAADVAIVDDQRQVHYLIANGQVRHQLD